MKKEQSKAWYVGRRGELLAQEFLMELGIVAVSLVQSDLGFDYIGISSSQSGAPIVFGVEVKATEQEVGNRFPFRTSRLIWYCDANIPILLIVADVKTNQLYFTWATDAVPMERWDSVRKLETCNISLRHATPEERHRLKKEIQQFGKPLTGTKGSHDGNE